MSNEDAQQIKEQDDEPSCPACHSYWVTNTYDDDTDQILLYCRECGLMWKWAWAETDRTE